MHPLIQTFQTKDKEETKRKKSGVGSATTATAAVETRPRGEEAKTTRSRDGTWIKKHGKSFFGYTYVTGEAGSSPTATACGE